LPKQQPFSFLLDLESNGGVILCAGVEHNPDVFVVGVGGDHSALACGNDHAGRRILQDVRIAECLIRAVIGGGVGEEVANVRVCPCIFLLELGTSLPPLA
jgi:hypothetical protein